MVEEVYTSMYSRNAELYHHGIQGQKWGVRNGPPYPIEDKNMRTGTTLSSVSTYKSGKHQLSAIKTYKGSLYTYNPEDKHDEAVYKGPFAKYLLSRSGISTAQSSYFGQVIPNAMSPLLETKYEVIKDLRMPTSKERYDIYAKMMQSPKGKIYVKEMQKVQSYMKNFNLPPEKKAAVDADLSKLNDSKNLKDSYQVFNTMMESTNSYNLTKDYMKAMKKDYDAMVDDNNQGVYNSAHDPVMIFNPGKVLKIIEENKNTTYGDIEKAYRYVAEEQRKKGKNVAF